MERRSFGALGVSSCVHGAVFALMIWVGAHSTVPPSATAISRSLTNRDVVWLDVRGPSGGGGGGGHETPGPPRLARLKGDDTITVPVREAPELEHPKDTPDENPVQNLVIPAETLAAATTNLIGSIEGIPTSDSLGFGRRAGAGAGDGPGAGPGVGPGYGGNRGGGPPRPGGDVASPVPVFQPRPQYTSEAMRAKIQGRLLLECVVFTDGTVGEIHVLRSLDPVFGLDQEGIKAARSWRFRPGMRRGEPVAVLVSIEMAFALR